jgi:hypothetical protein
MVWVVDSSSCRSSCKSVFVAIVVPMSRSIASTTARARLITTCHETTLLKERIEPLLC